MIHKPLLVALDSSHWEQWIADSYSGDAQRCAVAGDFEGALMDLGFTVLLTMHHLVELMAHENDEAVAKRLRFVRARPFLSWIGSIGGGDRVLGDITDVMAAEVAAALDGHDLQNICEVAKRALLQSGAGAESIPEHPDFLPFLKSWARDHAHRARTVTAVGSWCALPDDMRVHDLMAGRLRDNAELLRVVSAQFRTLTSEIEARGDKRIDDAPDRALDFFRQVIEKKKGLPDTAREFVVAAYAREGIDADEIRAESTVGEMGRLAVFRSQLCIIVEKLGLDFGATKRRITPEQLPHRVVLDALQRYGQQRERRSGGDLYDSYLASISIYADVTFTDKRTHLDFQQARSKAPPLDSITGKVEKAPRYGDIVEVLRRNE